MDGTGIASLPFLLLPVSKSSLYLYFCNHKTNTSPPSFFFCFRYRCILEIQIITYTASTVSQINRKTNQQQSLLLSMLDTTNAASASYSRSKTTRIAQPLEINQIFFSNLLPFHFPLQTTTFPSGSDRIGFHPFHDPPPPPYLADSLSRSRALLSPWTWPDIPISTRL